MRFGLPDGFDTVVVRPLVNFDEEHHYQHEDYLQADISPSYNSQFKSFYQSIHDLEESLNEMKVGKLQNEYQQKKLHLDKNNSVEGDNISVTREKFDSILGVQRNEVDAIIRREQERIKRVQEEQKRKAEEEKKRVEEETKRKEEEEKKKKMEEEKRATEKKNKEAEEKRLKEEEAKKQVAAAEKDRAKKEAEKRELAKKDAAAAAAVAAKLEDCPANIQLKNEKIIADIKSDVVLKLKEQDANLRKAVSGLKRKINPKFGQLSNSFLQLQRITDEVVQLINFAKVESGNELVYRWILNFVAKAIVSQAETEVTVKSTAALPLARLSQTLLVTFSEFEYYFKARLIKKCPFIIGYTCSVESEEGRKRMGWRRREGSKWEDDVKYDERVAGICTFWAVITRLPAPPQQQIGLNKFFQIESSWTFVARIANTPLDLLSNAHFVCLSNWWEACASNILATYKKQGYKLLQVISVTLTKKVIEKKYPGAARLLILGEEFFQKGDIETIKEMER